MGKNIIDYPYLPKGRKISYVGADNKFIKVARDYAKTHSADRNVPTGSVIVHESEAVGYGANGSDYHEKFGCQRVKKGIPTGQGYELCEGCHPKNHSEPRAIKDAKERNPSIDLNKADLYLWGHWWACEPCWNAIDKAGIKNVYLVSESHKIFNKSHPQNVIGRQFSYN